LDKVCVYTLGCRLNQCESEGIADAFTKEGFEIVDENGGAELYIVNTCTVTTKAEQKARRMIRKFAQRAVTIVTGCYAQMNAKDIEALEPGIIVVTLNKKAQLLKLPKHMSTALLNGMTVRESVDTFTEEDVSPFDYDAASFAYHSRAYLKVQDGCDNNCGYCRVHVARGKSQTLDAAIVVQRALDLEKEGFSEIMLTGVNLTMYDHTGDGLGGLLEKLLASLGPDIRIRLSSLEADHVDDRVLNAMKDYRVQPHFHTPIQSASDHVLKRVNRKYDKNHLIYMVEKMRSIKDDPFIAADIIAGLPSETEEDFEETYAFLEKYQFAQLHVFPYSPRPNTPLYGCKDKLPEYLRDERAKKLRDLSEKLHQRYLERHVGKDTEIVLQERSNGHYTGLSGNYIDVIVDGEPAFAKVGSLYKAKFTSIEGDKMHVDLV